MHNALHTQAIDPSIPIRAFEGISTPIRARRLRAHFMRSVAGRQCNEADLKWLCETLRSTIMTGKLKGIFLVAALAGASHAMASGYGPAPYYSPMDGAPMSQQGMNIQTIAQDAQQTNDASVDKSKQDSPLMQAQD